MALELTARSRPWLVHQTIPVTVRGWCHRQQHDLVTADCTGATQPTRPAKTTQDVLEAGAHRPVTSLCLDNGMHW